MARVLIAHTLRSEFLVVPTVVLASRCFTVTVVLLKELSETLEELRGIACYVHTWLPSSSANLNLTLSRLLAVLYK